MKYAVLTAAPKRWHSELTLGHIFQQSAQGGSGNAQRGQWLGEGFYGHTEGWAVVRAGQGLLLSTSARSAQGSSVAGTQMDAAEAVGQLKAARQLGDTLSQSAKQQGAQGLRSFDAAQALQQHTDAMDAQAQGKYSGNVGGQEAKKAKGRTLGEAVERFNQPLIHLDTPVSASFVTPSSISLFSGQDTSLAMQGDAHLTSAHTLSSVSGQTTSLYTHAGGIKGITANGPLSLRAHTDAQQIWSDKDLTVQSTTDEIRIQASDSITLTAGQSQIVIKGGDITFTCPGKWTVKGAGHAWAGGGSQAAQLAALPDQRFAAYCQVMYKAEAVAGGYVPEVIKSAYQDARVWVYGVLAAAIKDQASGRIRQPQIDGYDFAHSIDPTHTMVAKDANDHPLHDLAGSLAQKAVLDVGRCVADVWEGKATTEEAVACASKYFKHPSYATEFDEKVAEWALTHPDLVLKASDQSGALKRAREHQHDGEGHDHKASLPKQFHASWTFWTEHYAALTGRQDVLASIPPGEVA